MVRLLDQQRHPVRISYVRFYYVQDSKDFFPKHVSRIQTIDDEVGTYSMIHIFTTNQNRNSEEVLVYENPISSVLFQRLNRRLVWFLHFVNLVGMSKSTTYIQNALNQAGILTALVLMHLHQWVILAGPVKCPLLNRPKTTTTYSELGT